MRHVVAACVLALVITGVVVTRHHAWGRETLTAEHVRNALSAAGFNPGTTRDGYVLRSVHVEAGEHRGEFVVRIKIEPVQ